MTRKDVDLSPGNLHGYRYYQAINGGIYIATPNGRYSTALTKKQIDDLQMYFENLPDFNNADFKTYYRNQPRGGRYGIEEEMK